MFVRNGACDLIGTEQAMERGGAKEKEKGAAPVTSVLLKVSLTEPATD